MIENIRKYNILIIIGLVVVVVALVIGLQAGSMGGPGGAPYIKIGSRSYTDTEYRQYGVSGREIVMSLAQAGDFQRMYQFLFSLSPNSMFSQSPEDGTEAFFINRMLVRQAKKDFGIHPSDDQISEFIQSLSAFRGADQQFDPEIYARYIDKGLGRMGMGERQLRELISDIITTNQLRAIIGSGLLVHPDIAAKSNALDQQSISGSVATLELAPYKEKIDPSDEELKSYWELIQDAFMTEEKRRFSYILVAPDPVEEQAAAEDDKQPTIAEAAMSAEDKKIAAEKKAKEKADKEAMLAEERREKQRTLDLKVDDFTFILEEQEGEGFDKLAEKNGWEVHSTELFSRSSPPEALDLQIRSGTRTGSALDQLFAMLFTKDPISRISQPLAVGENQWLVARLEEVVASEVKTFEQAHDQVRKQYIEEKALEELEKAMDEAAEKVGNSLDAGKTFAEASVNAGLTDVEVFTKLTSSINTGEKNLPNGLFRMARAIEPGKISEVIVQGDRAHLLHIESREVEDGVNSPDVLETQINIAANQNSMAAFSDWLKNVAEASNIQRLYRR